MVTLDSLRSLVVAEAGPAVSIFMPTHTAGREIRQDPIRLKTLLDDAEKQMVTMAGCRRPEAEALLDPARQLEGDGDFWRHQNRGLAVFAARDIFHYFQVPSEFDEQVVVARRFEIKPMLPLLDLHRQFLVLAVSARRARLFAADPAGMVVIPTVSLPAGVAEVSAETNYEDTRQTNPGSGAAKTQALGNTPEDQRKAELVKYLHRVASALQQQLADDRRQIVLAAQPEVRGNFQAISRLRTLLPESLDTNPDALDLGELHRRAYELAKPVFERRRVAAQEQLAQLLGEQNARATIEPGEVVASAHDGRVDTLFLAENADLWGGYDESTRRVIVHQRREAEDDELLNYAAAQTLLHSGRIMMMPRDRLPRASVAAALLRY